MAQDRTITLTLTEKEYRLLRKLVNKGYNRLGNEVKGNLHDGKWELYYRKEHLIDEGYKVLKKVEEAQNAAY